MTMCINLEGMRGLWARERACLVGKEGEGDKRRQSWAGHSEAIGMCKITK